MYIAPSDFSLPRITLDADNPAQSDIPPAGNKHSVFQLERRSDAIPVLYFAEKLIREL